MCFGGIVYQNIVSLGTILEKFPIRSFEVIRVKYSSQVIKRSRVDDGRDASRNSNCIGSPEFYYVMAVNDARSLPFSILILLNVNCTGTGWNSAVNIRPAFVLYNDENDRRRFTSFFINSAVARISKKRGHGIHVANKLGLGIVSETAYVAAHDQTRFTTIAHILSPLFCKHFYTPFSRFNLFYFFFLRRVKYFK